MDELKHDRKPTAVDELMLDIIEIVNPCGEVLDEIEERFLEFKKEL
tara:strand:- start:201 stop:338 length:138 start_codon:yes stop_codon:yes gene_type:complete